MKKNILLILLSCFALTGCELDLGFFKLGKETENTPKTPENPEENKEIEDDDPTDEQIGEYTVTIPLCGPEFSSITSGQAGYVFADHPDVLDTYCASKLDATNMLSGITFENLNTAVYKNVLYLSLGTGYYANNKFKEGIFTWTSPLPIHKVEIQGKAYSKLDNNGATDIQSVVWIDNTSLSLECASDEDPTSDTLCVEYENGTQSFTLKSTGSRVMLESLKITWSYIYEA